jgi:HK97 family phage prohead protease
MLHKTFDLLETKTDTQAGTFEATVAVFGNIDRGGDRIMPGAFTKTLQAWKDSGDPIPVILSHQWDNPMAHIGVVQDAKETDKGLWVKGTLDIADNDVARQVHKLMARRSLKEFSFGYEVPKGGEKRAKDGANDLLEVTLAEVGPTLKGMNQATELHSVKSALDGGTPDADELREKTKRVEREAEQDRLPDVPEPEPVAPEPEIDVVKELQEVKARLAVSEKALEDLRKKAEATDREPRARSVDPLRKQAEDLALELASDGESLRKPPRKVPPKAPELTPLPELKRQMRDEMLARLSEGIPE